MMECNVAVECGPGYSGDGSSCRPCGIGFFSAKTGSEKCEACGGSLSTQGEASASEDECMGKYSYLFCLIFWRFVK